MLYYHYFFTLKCNLHVQIQNFFLAPFAPWDFINQFSCLFREHATKHHIIVMNFLLGKALISLLFYLDNPYFFTTFSKFVSLRFPYFFVEGYLKACNIEYCRKNLLGNIACGLEHVTILASTLNMVTPKYKQNLLCCQFCSFILKKKTKKKTTSVQWLLNSLRLDIMF